MFDSVMRTRRDCRLCGSASLELALPMRPSPIGDAYITKDQLAIVQPSYPLDLYLCQNCSHLQLPHVINPEILFGNYIYLTSTSPGLVNHFKAYANAVLEKISCQQDSLVVEIGSNDGSLLKFFNNNGMRVLGVDPAREIARKASESGIETIPAFFTLDLARRIKAERGAADIIAANNVFAHADNITEIVEGIRYLLSPEGIFVFEVSYLGDMIEKNVFDTIYHEHLCHYSIMALENLFHRYEMCLFDIERISTKGGSIRGFAKHRHSIRKISPVVQEYVQHERKIALNKIKTYQLFSHRLEQIKNDLHVVLDRMKSQNKKIAGYGASTPVTTTIYQFELGPYLDFIADDNTIKQGRFSPGHHIPVLPSRAIYEQKPDCMIILAWQYADLIMKNHEKFIEQGGCFILPLPTVKIFNHENTLFNTLVS